MKYLWRLFLYLFFFFIAFSVVSVALLRFLPVTVTPLKVIRMTEKEGAGLKVKTRWYPLEEIAPVMARAVVTTEDNRFLTHSGFDFEAIEKALEHNRQGKRLRGASTISQQTAKNVFCLPDRTWVRKGIEAYFTVLIEGMWGKRRIMEVYLNVIETHPGVYGVGAASEIFYGKPPSRLNVYEAWMLATVLPNPFRMNLEAPSSYMVNRAARVRRYMSNLGEIDFDRPAAAPEEKRKVSGKE